MALLLTALAAACGGSGPSLPSGYQLHRDADMGFQVGLPSGWRELGPEPAGVDFSDASGQLVLLVHAGAAASTDAAVEARTVVAGLNGGALTGAGSAATLSGLPGRRLRGSAGTGAVAQAVEAVVALQGSRSWALVLTAPAAKARAAAATLDSVAGTFALVQERPPSDAAVATGRPAPRFSELDAIQGPVVLNFFATWCAPCQSEMPMLAQRAGEARGRYTVLAVDTRDDPAQVPAFTGRLGIRLPVAYDRDGRLGQVYRVPGLPSTFFLDAHHVVRASALGPVTPASLDAGLRAAGVART